MPDWNGVALIVNASTVLNTAIVTLTVLTEPTKFTALSKVSLSTLSSIPTPSHITINSRLLLQFASFYSFNLIQFDLTSFDLRNSTNYSFFIFKLNKNDERYSVPTHNLETLFSRKLYF